MRCLKISLIAMTFVMAVNVNVFALSNSSISTNQTTEDVDDNILTVEEATQRAISYNKDLKTLKENLSLAEDDAKDTNKDLFYANEYSEVTSLSVQLKNLYNNIENYKANEEITKKSLELSVIEYFSSIKNAQKSIELFEEQLSISEKELEIAQVKLNLGLISQSEFDDKKNSYTKTKNEKINLESTLDNSYISLNKLLGYDLNSKYELELDIEYEQMEEIDLDAPINKALSSTQSIKEKQNAVTVAKYELDVYSSLYSNDKKESKENSYAQTQRALTDAKTDLNQSLTQLYNNIITSENQIESNYKDLEQLNKEYEIKQVQYSLGKVTELELNEAEYKINSLEADIESAVYSHTVNVRKFLEPDLI